MSILQEILHWSKGLPPWQSDALRRLFMNGSLSNDDIDDLFALLKAEHGIPDSKSHTAKILSADQIPVSVVPDTKIKILALKNLRHVNAIAENQHLNFSSMGLTLIYGDNGSGKSGYARVFKNACRARDQSELIHPNAFLPDEQTGNAEATFDIEVNGIHGDVPWVNGAPAPEILSSLAVFDSRCARSYLDEEGDFAYIPYGLDILEGLAGACKKLKTMIELEHARYAPDRAAFSDLGGETAVGKLISGLSHQTKLEQAEKKIRKLTEPYGLVPLEELERREEQARGLDARLGEHRTRLETLLAGETAEAFQGKLALLETRITTISTKYPEWENNLPNSDRLQREFRAVKEKFVLEVERAEGEWEKAQISLSEATSRISNLEGELARNQNLAQSLEAKLANLLKEVGDEKTLAELIARTGLEFEGARAGLEEAEKKLAGYDEDPLIILERLQKRLDAAWDTSRQALSDEKITEGELRQLGGQGAYSLLVRAEEEAASLTRELAAETLQVNAVRLLFDTLNDCRSEMTAGLVAPVEQKANYILLRIAGRRPGPLKLNEGLNIPEVLPDQSGPGVALDQVSGGEREQIYLATRLALAELLALNERQLVVLDDVLTFTDAARMARVMDVLEESGQRLQILIITCHPERYRGLNVAKFFDLEEIIRTTD